MSTPEPTSSFRPARRNRLFILMSGLLTAAILGGLLLRAVDRVQEAADRMN